MKQRRPFHISRDRVVASFGGFGIELLPSEIQRRTKLSRPTVFNVLKYYTDKGFLTQKGKKYRLSQSIFKTKEKRKEPLKGSWLMRYEYLLHEWAKRHGTTVEDMPELAKEFIEIQVRHEEHFVNLDGADESFKKLPGWKSERRKTENKPLRKDNNYWKNQQKEILRAIKKH